MSSELTTTTPQSGIVEQMEYARAVSSGDLLPQAYRGKPANVLVALGLGQAMGLSYAESLYRIDVIQGKPTASAELIAANVRKAGHKLRVRVDEQATSATATIIRADDPDYEHTVTRDRAWAERMGLFSKDNYKKQPTTMLQWRAISAVARQACPEALYGVTHTTDELDDMPNVAPRPTRRVSAADFAPPATVEAEPDQEPVDVTRLPEQTDDAPDEPRPSNQQLSRLYATLEDIGVTAKGMTKDQKRATALAYIGEIVGREVGSSSDLSRAEVFQVIAAAEFDRAEQPPADDWPETAGGEA